MPRIARIGVGVLFLLAACGFAFAPLPQILIQKISMERNPPLLTQTFSQGDLAIRTSA